MLTQDRHRLLLARLEETGAIKAQGLLRELRVTPMTLWRDLRLLEARGLLRRVHGGAVRIDRSVEPAFGLKQRQSLAEKRLIAATAARRYVAAGDAIILEGGTTVAEMLAFLPTRDLTVMTNSVPILGRAQALGRSWQIHGSGGTLSPVSGNLIGAEALGFFRGKFAATFFMSGTGLDPETGALTDPNPLEIEVKRAMARAARRVVLLLDSSKLGVRSLEQVLPLGDVEVMLCDDRISARAIRQLQARGLAVKKCR